MHARFTHRVERRPPGRRWNAPDWLSSGRTGGLAVGGTWGIGLFPVPLGCLSQRLRVLVRNSLPEPPKTPRPEASHGGTEFTEVCWHPCRDAGPISFRIRWCRCAPPPATGLDASGIRHAGHCIPPWPVTPGVMGGKNPAEPQSRRDPDPMEAVAEGKRRVWDERAFRIIRIRWSGWAVLVQADWRNCSKAPPNRLRTSRWMSSGVTVQPLAARAA